MHEWALAEAVIESVKENIGERKIEEVRKVIVLFGELQNVDPEIFKSGIEMLLENSPLKKEVFVMEIEKAEFFCNVCSDLWTLDAFPNLSEDELEAIHFMPESSHVYICCPKCGSPDFRISKGRGVSIKSILLEIEEDR